MKFLMAATVVAGLFTAAPAFADLELANKKGCMACHKEDAKHLGPSYKEVAAKYKGDAAAVDTLANVVMKGSSAKGAASGEWMKAGKAMTPMMPPNNVTAEEAKKLVQWVLAH